jgi:hypothetical protein
MEFNKKRFFKRQFTKGIVWSITAFILMGVAFLIRDTVHVSGGIDGIIFFVVVVILATLSFAYITFAGTIYQNAKEQKQYFSDDGILEAFIVKETTYPYHNPFGRSTNKNYYLFRRINKIGATPFDIVVTGDILCSRYGLGISQKKGNNIREKKHVFIPRNFTNEEKILCLNIKRYNQNFKEWDKNPKNVERWKREINIFM